jgi:hypothetical protein
VVTLVGLPENLTAVAVLPVAYFEGDDFKAAKRVPARERTHWNTWELDVNVANRDTRFHVMAGSIGQCLDRGLLAALEDVVAELKTLRGEPEAAAWLRRWLEELT